MTHATELARGLSELGLEVAVDTQRKMLEFLALIGKWNRVYNLTAVRDSAQMISSHLLDCLSIAPHLHARTVLDVGSGAGLPGVPLALLWPHATVTLLDSNHKKAAFLQQAVIELEIKNADVVCERIELWRPPQLFDLVISRAFSALPEFLQLASRHCSETGILATMKGVQPNEEIANLPRGFVVRNVTPLRVPGLNAERHLIQISPQH
jgi:16S rRNA (guanine527-N7)-methyltransferase